MFWSKITIIKPILKLHSHPWFVNTTNFNIATSVSPQMKINNIAMVNWNNCSINMTLEVADSFRFSQILLPRSTHKRWISFFHVSFHFPLSATDMHSLYRLHTVTTTDIKPHTEGKKEYPQAQTHRKPLYFKAHIGSASSFGALQ